MIPCDNVPLRVVRDLDRGVGGRLDRVEPSMSTGPRNRVSGERRTHFRDRRVAGRRVELRFRRQAGEFRHWQAVVTEDIGLGGAFVMSPAPLPAGTRLDVEIAVPPADQPIVTVAEVRWCSTGERSGMGLRFDPLDVDARLALSEYFATLPA
jgi:hypothetical protein